MNNIIKRKWNQNSMVIIEDLQGMAFQAESGGHTFQISGIDGEGNAVALSGTPAGVMLRSDGQDVTLTCSVSGGVVSATLPANAYSVPGRFGLTIFLTSDGQKTAIYAAVGTVGKTSSGTVAPPAGSDVVDLVNAIATAVATIPASYTDLMASVAPTYSSSGLYAVGSYAWYNGKLYRCTTAITSGETWTSGHWTLANLGSDLVDLKSAINKNSGIEVIELIPLYYYDLSNNSITIGTPTSSEQRKCALVSCSPGDYFTVSGTGGTKAILWGFVDSNGNILCKELGGTSRDGKNIQAPANASYLVINNALSDTAVSFKGIVDKTRIDNDEIYDIFALKWRPYSINYTTGAESPTLSNGGNSFISDKIKKDDCAFIKLIDSTIVSSYCIIGYDANGDYAGVIQGADSGYELEKNGSYKCEFTNTFSTDMLPDGYSFSIVASLLLPVSYKNMPYLSTAIAAVNFKSNQNLFQPISSKNNSLTVNGLDSSNNGYSLTTNSKRAHTGYIYAKDAIRIAVPNGYKLKSVYYYDANYEYIDRSSSNIENRAATLLNNGKYYIRVTISKADDTQDMGDLTGIYVSVYGASKLAPSPENEGKFVDRETPINPEWEGWSSDRYSWGFDPNAQRIYEYINGILESNMFSVKGGKGRWHGASNFENGGHLFEGWNKDENVRFTILIGKYDEKMTCIQTYGPPGLNDGSRVWGYLKLGSDNLEEGVNIGKDALRSFVPICLSTTRPTSVQEMVGFDEGTSVPVGATYYDTTEQSICVMTSSGWKKCKLEDMS